MRKTKIGSIVKVKDAFGELRLLRYLGEIKGYIMVCSDNQYENASKKEIDKGIFGVGFPISDVSE